MAEIINKTYGSKGATTLVADLQTLWDFIKIETDTNNYGVSVNLWVNDYTYLQIYDTQQSSPTIAIIHKGMQVVAYNGTSGSGALYAAKTNSATILTYQAKNTTTVSNHGSLIMIGKAANQQTGAEENIVSTLKYHTSVGIDYYDPYICAPDTSSTAINLGSSISYGSSFSASRMTVLRPFTMNESSFVMKSIYRMVQSQVIPFIGDCTLNGRKFHAIGVVFAEDD